jgi:hypothetical protein
MSLASPLHASVNSWTNYDTTAQAHSAKLPVTKLLIFGGRAATFDQTS